MNLELFTLVWPLSLVAPVVLYALSLQPVFGKLRGSAAHPYNILGFFLTVVAFDFLDVYTRVASGGTAWFARYTIASVGEIESGLFFFLLMSGSIVVGLLTARSARRIDISPAHDPEIAARATTLVLLGSLAVTGYTTLVVVTQSVAAGSLFEVAGVRQIFFRENPLLQVFYATLVPAFILFLSHNTHRIRFVAVLLLTVVLLTLPLGSRGSLFYLLIAVIVGVAMTRARLPAGMLYFAAPAVLAILVYLRFLREQVTDSFSRYLEIRGSELLLEGADFSLAEPLIIGMRSGVVPRYPFETLVGSIFAVVPRGIIPWKPEGPSAVFTGLADPMRWALTKSEWLITGFVNLNAELGMVGAAVAMVVLAAIWARSLARTFSSTPNAIAGASFLAIVAYIFVRGDLYNVALFIWPSLFVYLGFRLAKKVLSRRRQSSHQEAGA